MDYFVPAKTTRIELRSKNSRFIATAAYAPTVKDAKAFVADIRREFSDASHCVPVYIVGHGATVVEHCNDDGEPSGTAGRPMLAVVRGSGLGDIAIVATRYFGGTKLGTGGLVQAYASSAKEVLDALPRARRATLMTLHLQLPYSQFEPVKLAIQASNGVIASEDFAADVSVEVAFDQSGLTTFLQSIAERWPTSVTVTKLGEHIGIL